MIQIRFFEQLGVQLGPSLQKEIEKHYSRRELRRTAADEVGDVTYPARVREGYAQDLLDGLDIGGIPALALRLVFAHCYSAASFVLPLFLGPLGVEVVSAHEFSSAGATRGST